MIHKGTIFSRAKFIEELHELVNCNPTEINMQLHVPFNGGCIKPAELQSYLSPQLQSR